MPDLSFVAVIAVWISLATLFYVYAGYPLLLSIAGLLTRKRRSSQSFFPKISILIAAYNEEAGIAQKLKDTLVLDYPADKLEILVLSDASTDRTDEIVKAFHDPRIRLVRAASRKGKTNVQNYGAGLAKGEILVFSDATTVYHRDALRHLVGNFAEPSVGAVSGCYRYFDRSGTSPTGLGMIAFWNYENTIKMMQSRIGTITGCCGCIYAVRRNLYTPLSPAVISDLVQPLWVIRQGYRVKFEERALAYEETTKSAAEEFSMRVRVVTRGIRGILSVPDLLNPIKYGWVSLQLLSHKVLRWLVPFWLLLLLIGSAALVMHAIYRDLFALQLGFYGFALLAFIVPLHRMWKPLGIPLYFCTLNAAAFCSILEVIRGRKYVVWETVRS